jgi:hypothetical protein
MVAGAMVKSAANVALEFEGFGRERSLGTLGGSAANGCFGFRRSQPRKVEEGRHWQVRTRQLRHQSAHGTIPGQHMRTRREAQFHERVAETGA